MPLAFFPATQALATHRQQGGEGGEGGGADLDEIVHLLTDGSAMRDLDLNVRMDGGP